MDFHGLYDRLFRTFRDAREIRLLSAREFKTLFPEGLMIRERFAGLSKSLITIFPGL